MDYSSERDEIASSTNPVAPGYRYHGSATTTTSQKHDYVHYGHTNTRSHHSHSHSHGSSSRRRPKIGIFSASSEYYAATAGMESHAEGLELALQDTSKTTSSSSATISVSSPGTSSSSHRNDKELAKIEHRHQHNQHQEQTRTSLPAGTHSRPPSLNPTNPFGPSYPSCSTTTTNPFEDHYPVLTEQSQCDDETDHNPDDVYFDANRPLKGQPASSSLVSSTLQKLPSKNLSAGLDTTTNPFGGPDMNEDIRNDNNSSTSSASRDDFSGSPDYLALHRLFAEATGQDDITWRNALYLLGMKPELARETTDKGYTPLHVACLGGTTSTTSTTTSQRDKEVDLLGIQAMKPSLRIQKQQQSVSAPDFIIRALVLANPSAVQLANTDGRLPIHCLAASSANVGGLQILVEANPTSTSVRDAMGWTPLHLLLLNTRVHVTKAQLQILLGMTVPPEERLVSGRVRQRRGDHLRLPVEQLSRMLPNPTQNRHRHEISAEIVASYPEDIQVCLKRLQKWERKQSRLEKKRQPEREENQKEASCSSSDGIETACFGDERNPAAIVTPVDHHLPLHLAVHRGLLGLVKQSRVEQTEAKERCKRTKHQTDTNKTSRLPSLQHELIVFVRILLQAFPEGLITKDSNGHTPLIAAMTAATEMVPNQQLLELLLGKRTAGFEFLPSWVEDAPLPSPHMIVPSNGGLNMHQRRYCNPAMVSTVDTCQLPLHVAAEEWGDYPELILAIYESYPGAIHVQDARGRMPLHILLQNYRRVSPDPQIVALLLSNRVARTHTDEGELPFDLLIACAPFLPKDILRYDSLLLSPNASHTHPGPDQAFKHIFQPSIIASASAVSANQREHSTLMRRAEANTFLWRLRTLPPWLRRQACSASFVQEIIVKELSSPLRCAFVFAQGFVLVLLLACFRQQMERFIETADQAHIYPVSRRNDTASLSFFDGTGEELVNNLLSDRSGRYEPWNTMAIYGLGAGSITLQAISWTLAGSLNEFQRLCLLSLRRWMDFVAVSAAVLTSVMVHEGFPDNAVFIVGTVATGLLWGTVIGFLSDWWYGVSFFTGSIAKIVSVLLWPLLVAGIFVVAFAEMFYTVGQLDCVNDSPASPVCSIRDAYQLVYVLILRAPIVEIGDTDRLPSGLVILLAVFTLIGFLFLLGVAMVVVLIALQCDRESVDLDSYWEPKLAFVLASQDSKFASAARLKQEGFIPRLCWIDTLDARLDELWGVCVCLLLGTGKDRYWYALAPSTWGRICLYVGTCLFMPCWLVLGCLSFGILWPPQVRRFIFMPRLRLHVGVKPGKSLAYEIAGMRNEIMKLRDMSFEQSNDIHYEIRQLKATISKAQ